ncbi:lipase family protein [Nocardia transvalensis]|uniref:lipase family protein n=1 Tax=Nocardia transvalensis TaxID=37333 RepID=UPI00189442B4|nr:lipase family protein [Nocardia transvalensis]MBF6334112.1 lipase [Nocardia transvalensis]
MSLVADADSDFDGLRPAADQIPLPDSHPLRPEVDPFYLPPAALDSYSPGTILRSRRVRLALFGRIPQKVRAWQLLYRTNDLDGTPEAAVTTVMLPWDADSSMTRPLVSYQCAIDAVATKCLPSYALRHGARAFGSIPQFEILIIANALSRGWAVSVPDHVGTAGRFAVPREPGYRVLDGIRAALSFPQLGLDPTTRVGLWGYSAGGLATAWAAETAAEYAPELNITAGFTGSPVGDPTQAVTRLNRTVSSGLVALCLAGLRRAYPNLDRVRAQLSAEFLDLLAYTESRATIQIVLRGVGTKVADNGTGLTDLMTHPAVRAALAEVCPGSRSPDIPILIVQPVNDLIVPVDAIDEHVARYRAGGTQVRYIRDRLSGHVSLALIAAPMIGDWLAEHLAEPKPQCHNDTTTTVWSMALSPQGVVGHLRQAWLAARLLTGQPIG